MTGTDTVTGIRLPTSPGRIHRPTDPGDAERLLGALARWYLEFLAGRRPVSQLASLLSPAVVARIDARRRAVRGLDGTRPAAPGPAVVRSLRLQWTTDVTCEATVLVSRGARTTALAVTLQRLETGWRVVELSSPEDGVDALRAAVPCGSQPV